MPTIHHVDGLFLSTDCGLAHDSYRIGALKIKDVTCLRCLKSIIKQHGIPVAEARARIAHLGKR